MTGGTGFVGKNLTQKLLEEGHDVSVTSFSGENFPEGVCGIYSGDLTEINDRFDVVFHQAANNDTRDMDYVRMFRANVYDPIIMFNNLRKAGCVKFVYASSTAVYGNSPAPYTEDTPVDPLNPYAESKLAFDQFAMDFAKKTGTSVIGFRYCNVYGKGEEHKGSRMSMISQIYNKARKDEVVNLFKDGNQRRDWVHVSDVVKVNRLAMMSSKTGIYNIGGGASYTFKEVVQAIENALQQKVEVRFIDCPFEDEYQSYTECDITKVGVELGYHPSVNLNEGVRLLGF